MSFLSRLFGWHTERREAPGAASLAPPPAPAPAPPGTPVDSMGRAAAGRPPFPSIDLVAALLRGMGCVDIAVWAPVLARACIQHGITTKARLCAFLANVAHETGGLRHLVESLNYAPQRMLEVFGRHRITAEQAWALGRKPDEAALSMERQRAIALIVYGGEWGRRNLGNIPGTEDPWLFRGHGLLQLTGRSNFERFGKVIGRRAEELPALLATREGAADSAAHFFAASGCWGYADLGDIGAVREIINGPRRLGLAEVRALNASALIDAGIGA